MSAAFKAGMRARPVSRPFRFAGRRSAGELKFFDTTTGNVAVPSTGQISNVNLIPDGTTESERVGRKCVVTSVAVHGAIYLQTTTSVAMGNQRVRVLLVQDKQANGETNTAAATLALLLSASTPFGFVNLPNSGRYRIHSDRVYDCNYTAGNAAGGFQEMVKTFSIYKKLRVPLEFSGVTGALGEIRSNNLFVVTLSEAAAPQVNIAYTTRVRFSDS